MPTPDPEVPAPAHPEAAPRKRSRAPRQAPAITPERIAAAAADAHEAADAAANAAAAPAADFPSLLPLRGDAVASVVGPAGGVVSARPVAPGTVLLPPPVESDRRSLWLPLALVLLATVALVAVLFFAGRALVSAMQTSTQLPGSPDTPTWAIVVVLVVAALAVALGRLRPPRAQAPRRPQPLWMRVLDSRVIGSALAVALVVTAISLLRTPGSSFSDIREIPGQVSGAIQNAVAQPEPGYPRIRIKRVNIDLLLVKGDGKTPPVKYEAFTFPRADHLLAQQGTPGNSYVYAHARTGMFWNLHDLNIGDTVEIDYGGGKVNRYRVSEIHKSVNWKDFEWLQPTADDRLTLQTCNGWRDEDPRFIVVAHRIPDASTALAR